MTSHNRRVNVITRQRLLSDDFNNAGRVAGRELCLAQLAAALGDDYLDAGVGKGGVLGGFLVAARPGTNRITVQPGIAVVETTPSSTTYDPPVNWIELQDAIEVDLNAYIDPANPRLVTIEIEPNDATLVTGVVDVFDKNTGTFGVDPTAARVLGSSPAITVNAGTPAANPVVATGASGKLPLAVVKLVAAQGSFTDAYASVLMCRPLLQAPSSRTVPADYVRGGGVSVGEESGGAIVNLTDLYLSKLTASVNGVEAQVAGLIDFATLGRTPDTTDVATLLATTGPVYGYAVSPPWAAGDYGTVAPREAWQRNPNQIPYANVQNIVGGSGTTFTSLSAETTTSPGLTFRNAIVVWDSVAPYGLERGAGNAPVQIVDARGPHPDHAPGGSGTLGLDATQDPTWGATQGATDSVYVGSVAALNLAADFMAQSTRGSEVRLLDALDYTGGFAATRRPVISYSANQSDVAFYPGRFPGMQVGDTEVIPESADLIQCRAAFTAGTGPGTASFNLSSAYGFGRPDNGALVFDGLIAQIDTATADDYGVADNVWLNRSAAQSLRASLAIAAGSTSLVIALIGYEDEFLAARA